VHPSGERIDGVIGIGMPFPGPPNATCTYSLDGMYLHNEPSRNIHGEDTLQALLLAVRFVGYQLQNFRSKGGRIVFRAAELVDPAASPEDGGDIDVPLEATFGPLLVDRSPS